MGTNKILIKIYDCYGNSSEIEKAYEAQKDEINLLFKG